MMNFHTASPAETEAFAQSLSLFARPGTVILLEGDLGSGKSTFARAFIRALAADPALDVPSPSFSLIQTYAETRVPVAHADLYRLDQAGDLAELGLEDLARNHVLLVEWPRAGLSGLSPDVLHLIISGAGEARNILASPHGMWRKALERNGRLEQFLAASGVALPSRRFFEGDASFRRYERAQGPQGPIVIMDMPQRPDGPPVKHGLPYSAIAHLAEGLREVVAVNDWLEHEGYSAPHIFACDLQAGFAVLEDLGDNVFGRMMKAGADMDEPLRAAVDVLADMATRHWPAHVHVRGNGFHAMPRYDLEAQLIEVDLLPSWFHRHLHGKPAPESLGSSFAALWREVLPFTQATDPVWVLRDYHSPNLLWLPERKGLQRVGLIDTQDALLGHPAYDLASLLQDARVDVSFDQADTLYAHYVARRRAAGPFDEAGFARAYAILGAQRASKILGIFARLNYRDGKPQYLAHMPRVSRYLARNLQHHALSRLRRWFETQMPEALAIGHA